MARLGLSIQDIFILQVVFSVATVVLEVSPGYFADVFGRKGSLVLGVLMGTFGFFLYFLASGFVGFVVYMISYWIAPLEGVSWNQLTEELKGWLELRDILAIPA